MMSRGFPSALSARSRRSFTLFWAALFVMSLGLQYGSLASPPTAPAAPVAPVAPVEPVAPVAPTLRSPSLRVRRQHEQVSDADGVRTAGT